MKRQVRSSFGKLNDFLPHKFYAAEYLGMSDESRHEKMEVFLCIITVSAAVTFAGSSSCSSCSVAVATTACAATLIRATTAAATITAAAAKMQTGRPIGRPFFVYGVYGKIYKLEYSKLCKAIKFIL